MGNSVIFIGDDKHVREIALVSGVWHSYDLSAITGAPSSALGYDATSALAPAGGSTPSAE